MHWHLCYCSAQRCCSLRCGYSGFRSLTWSPNSKYTVNLIQSCSYSEKIKYTNQVRRCIVREWLVGVVLLTLSTPLSPVTATEVLVARLVITVHATHVTSIVIATASEVATPHRCYTEGFRVQLSLRSPIRSLRPSANTEKSIIIYKD